MLCEPPADALDRTKAAWSALGPAALLPEVEGDAVRLLLRRHHVHVVPVNIMAGTLAVEEQEADTYNITLELGTR